MDIYELLQEYRQLSRAMRDIMEDDVGRIVDVEFTDGTVITGPLDGASPAGVIVDDGGTIGVYCWYLISDIRVHEV
jgi:hypothetical protein